MVDNHELLEERTEQNCEMTSPQKISARPKKVRAGPERILFAYT